MEAHCCEKTLFPFVHTSMHRCSHCCAVTTNKTQGATSWQVPNEHLQHHILHWTWETAIIIIIIIIVIAKAIFKSWPFIMSLCFVKWREGESHTIHLAAQVSKLSESRSRPQLTVWLCPARWRHGGGGGEEKALRYLSGKYLKIPSPSTNLCFSWIFAKVLNPLCDRHIGSGIGSSLKMRKPSAQKRMMC